MALHALGTFHSSVISGSVPFGTDIRIDVPVHSMNGFAGIFLATAVIHMRAYAPHSTTWRSQRGEVDQVYFSRQLRPCGAGSVSLFHGWYGLSGLLSGSVANFCVRPSVHWS